MRLAWVIFGIALAACVAHEETTPQGYVIAPSMPADGGFVVDAGMVDAGR
jgi:hypothetical protein